MRDRLGLGGRLASPRRRGGGACARRRRRTPVGLVVAERAHLATCNATGALALWDLVGDVALRSPAATRAAQARSARDARARNPPPRVALASASAS